MRVRQRTRSLRVVWAPSLVRWLIRHRLVQAGVVGAVGLAMVTTVSTKAAVLDGQRAEWGELAAVAVVTEPVAPGEPVMGATEIRRLPLALTPPDAASYVSPDSLAKVALYPGEVVLSTRLTLPGRSSGGSSTAALTLPVAVQSPLLVEGDLVDLWIVDGADLSSSRVAEHVSVLAFSERDITVAVPNGQIERATAASLRPVIVTRIG